MIPPSFSLSGRTALISGAGQGIGRALALGLAGAGARVVVTDVSEANATRVADEVRAGGCDAIPRALDVRDPNGIEALVAWTDRHVGPIDVLVNNAGIRDQASDSLSLTVAEWDEVFSVNVRGLFLLSRGFARGMVKRRSGAIIQVASQLGLVGMAGRPAYTASKGAVVNLTRTLALEWAPHGVRVNAVAYGPIRTPFTERFIDDPVTSEAFRKATPLGPWPDADSAVGAVVFLASPASSFATGSIIVVDGGFTAQ